MNTLLVGLAAVVALGQENPGADLYRHAARQLGEIERDAQGLRTQALAELVGREYYHRSTDPRGPFLPHTAEQVEGWFQEPLEKLKQAAAGLEADHAALEKSDPKMTLDRFQAETYGRIGAALELQWTLARRALVGGRTEPGSRIAMLSAVNERGYDARLKTWEQERQKLDRSSPEYRANLAALEAKLRAEETATWATVAAPYRETAVRLREIRRRLAGDLWLWQDIAFRRSVVKGDLHAAAESAFRSQVYGTFGWSRTGNGSLERLVDAARLGFRQVTTFFNLDAEPRFGELRPADDLWSFTVRGFLNEPVEDLRRGEDRVPALAATGTPLEQIVKLLHARLRALRALGERGELLEREMLQRSERLDALEALRDRLPAWRRALDAYLAVAVPARDDASRWNDADAELKRDEADVERKTAALQKARSEAAGVEKELRVRPGGDVVRAPELGGKKAPGVAEAERSLQGKIDTLRQNPDAPRENLARLEAELADLRKKRDAALAPARQRVEAAEKELAAATASRDRAVEALRKIPAPKDPGPALKDLQAAVAAARAEAVGPEKRRAALAEAAPVPPELPAFTAEAATGPILKACTDVRAAVAAAEAALEKAVERSLEDLRRDAGDYAALGRYQEQLARDILVLRRDGTVAARNGLEGAGGDPQRDPIFDELDKLSKKLEKVLRAFDAVGTLLPERVDFLAEPTEGKPVGLDEILRKTTDALGLMGRVLKHLKKGADVVLAAEELRRRLSNDDPAGRVPVAGAVIGRFIGFYADATEAALRAARSLQARIIGEALAVHFHDNQAAAPERRLYTVDDLKAIVADRLQNTDAAATELKRLAVLFQVRRLLTLAGAGPRSALGDRP